MKLFDAVPSELFSVLSSPNRVLYSDALDVLYCAYRENLKIPEKVLISLEWKRVMDVCREPMPEIRMLL